MIDYDALYTEIINYLGQKFDITLPLAAEYAEELTDMVRQRVEEEISNYEVEDGTL